MQRGVKILTKNVPYTKAAKNPIKKLLPKNNRIEMIFQKINIVQNRCQTPSQYAIEKQP